MEADWVQIYTTTYNVQAQLVKNMLESNLIKTIMLDKTGTPYFVLGEIELYVHVNDAETAIQYIYDYDL